MRTRRQKAQQQEAGIPPTPPQQLPTTTRTRRGQITRENGSAEPPQPSSKPSRATTRGGSVSKRGRPTTSTKAKKSRQADATAAAVVAAAAIHEEASTQSDPSAKEDGTPESDDSKQSDTHAHPVDVMADTHCELPDLLRTLAAAHPVLGPQDAQIARVTRSRAAQATNAQAKAPETPTDQTFLAGQASPTTPSETSLFFQDAAELYMAPPTPHQVSPQPFSTPSASIGQGTPAPQQVTSPVRAALRASALQGSPNLSLLEKSPLQASIPQETPILSLTQNSPTLGAPPPRASLDNDENDYRHVFAWPQRGTFHPRESHTILDIVLDVNTAEYICDVDRRMDPRFSLAIPTPILPDVLKFIAEHARAQGSALQYLLHDQPVANILTDSKLTNDFNAVHRFQEPLDLVVSHHSDSPHTPDNRHNLRDAYGTTQKKLKDRQALEETSPQVKTRKISTTPKDNPSTPTLSKQFSTPSSQQTSRTPRANTTSSSWYDLEGNLRVGRRPSESTEVDLERTPQQAASQSTDENRLDSPPQEALQHEPQTPQTPQPRGWGLASFIPSVPRTVSKYLPGLGRYTPSTHLATIPRAPRTDGPAQRSHPPQDKRATLITKAEAASRLKAKEKKKQLKERIKELEAERVANEERIKRLEEEARAHREASETSLLGTSKSGGDATPRLGLGGVEISEANPLGMRRAGEKRRRPPSPEVFPNPPGCTYGLDDAIYDYSDTEGTESRRTSASSKRARTSSGGVDDHFVDPFNATPYTHVRGDTLSGEVIGDPLRARPYTGTLFAIKDTPPKQHRGANLFGEQTSAEKAASEAGGFSASPNTPQIGPTMVFKVPSPSDSDSSDDESSPTSAADKTPTPATNALSGRTITTPTLAQSTAQPQTMQVKSKVTQPASEGKKAPQQMPPPARPTQPQQPQMPASSQTASADQELALANARKRALKHTPSQPSRLRESSRLSSSPARPPPLSCKDSDTGSQSYTNYQKKVSKKVTDCIENHWDLIADPVVASLDFEMELSHFKDVQGAQPAPTHSTTDKENLVSSIVQQFLDSSWTSTDDEMADAQFGLELQAFNANKNAAIIG